MCDTLLLEAAAVDVVRAFHAEVARDLLRYLGGLGAVSVVVTLLALRQRTRMWSVAALALVLGAGVLGVAAHTYRAGIPARVAADVAALTTAPDSTQHHFATHYASAAAWPRFRRLARTWSALVVLGLVVLWRVRAPAARGIALAVVLLAALTFVLDAAAYRRDLRFAARWSTT